MREEICQAHMAGQMDAGCKEPSWSNAHAYFSTVEEKFNSMPLANQQLKAEIAALVNNFCDVYSGCLRSEAVSHLVAKLRQLSAV